MDIVYDSVVSMLENEIKTMYRYVVLVVMCLVILWSGVLMLDDEFLMIISVMVTVFLLYTVYRALREIRKYEKALKTYKEMLPRKELYSNSG